MSSDAPGKVVQSKSKLPWALFLVLLAGIYVFWILPIQLGPRHIRVQYEAANSAR